MDSKTIAEKNLILKVLVGSHLYGTNTERSDKDYVGIFIPTKDQLLGLYPCEQVEIRTNSSGSGQRNTSSDVDTTLYSLPKFIKLALGNNPNIVEIFFAPKKNILFCNDLGQQLLDSFSFFISKRVKHTFGGYAFSQKEKLYLKPDRLKAFRQTAEWLERTLQLERFQHEEVGEPIVVKGRRTYKIYEKGTPLTNVLADVRENLEEYGGRTTGIDEKGYDTKFASHLVRLLTEGIELLVEGQLTLPTEHASLLRDIKQGKHSLENLEQLYKKYEEQLELAYISSKLPNQPNMVAVNSLQIKLLEAHWQNASNQSS